MSQLLWKESIVMWQGTSLLSAVRRGIPLGDAKDQLYMMRSDQSHCGTMHSGTMLTTDVQSKDV